MTDSSLVDVHSRLTIVSSTPTEPMGQRYALSPLDHTMGSHTVHIIFYYRVSPFAKKGKYAMDLDNVRVSLSDLLSKYPRMTGRLVINGDGNWDVKYSDAGVRMYKASVGTTIDEWLHVAKETDERSLTTWEDMVDGDPTSWSPFQIQLSEFVGGGLAIGISYTHLLADPTSVTLFHKSWTDIDRGELVANHSPILNLPQLNNGAPLATNENATKYLQKSSKLASTSSTKMATITFKFSNTIIKQCLSKIPNKCPNATPFDYLTALFWLQLIKLKNTNTNSPTQSLSLCIDARKALDLAIPNKFFGNAQNFSQFSLQTEILMGENGLMEAVELVHNQVNDIKKDDIFSMLDWLESSRKELNGEYPKMVQMYGPELTCVSLEHLIISKNESKDEFESLVYESKFSNNEKPVHVSFHIGKAEGEGLIVVTPSSEGGLARTVTVTLPEEELSKLCEDPVIMKMEPTLILSGRR
ncbi:protein ECERIFERUM 2 [Rutidosis leptorrhynchoides]|uniref:protein ECERIFERUM 2 n=1 Tax=Rutidosis leptorrhynchoides TaxID=125765 RepID=UPI003A9977E8